jgi:cytochrome c
VLGHKIALFIEENGKDKGVSEIMNSADPFKRGKIGVGLNDFSGLNLANAEFPKMIGMNSYELKDPNGKQFVKEAISIVKTKGSGWIEFGWTSPQTKKIGRSKAFVQRVKGADLWVMTVISEE